MNREKNSTNPMRVRIGTGLFSAAFLAFGAVLGGNIYQIIVEVPNWSVDIPNSLIAYRSFYTVSHAGYFFQILTPVTILSLILAAVLLWNRPESSNKWILITLGGVLIAEAFTLIYFLPLNFTLFLDPIDGVSTIELINASEQWQNANYVRLLIVLATMFLFLKSYKTIFEDYKVTEMA